jgi:hypothetical protein
MLRRNPTFLFTLGSVMTIQTLYEQDFYSWIQQHVALLKESRFDELDIEHLIEELEGMSKKDRQELTNRLVILIAHLLKWQYQCSHRSNSWRSTIDEQRDQIIAGLLDEYPSLKSHLANAIEKSYSRAVKLACKETGLPWATFPSTCPYSDTQLLNEDFYPDNQ